MDLGKLPKRPSFENLPRRWVAERTFAWIIHNRRMGKDYECLCATGEAWMYAAMTPSEARRILAWRIGAPAVGRVRAVWSSCLMRLP